MKTVIAGLGSIGRRHLRNLAALGETDIILLRSRLATMPEADLAGYPVVTSIAEALAAKPDALVVANPTALHIPTAYPAVEQGVHILMEKPISHNLDQTDQLLRTAARSGSRILVGFQFRFHPTLNIARQLIASGELGDVVSFRGNWGEYLPNWHPWEDYRKSYAARADLGGGVTLTLCHPFDYLRWLFADEVERLWAFNGTSAEIGLDVDATAEVGLRFRKGMIGSVHLDYLQRPGSHSLEITCTRGRLLWDNATAQLRCYRAEKEAWQNYDAPEGFERNWLFVEEMKSFLSLARGEVESVCTLQDGIKALEIAQAATVSAATGNMIRFG